MEGGRELKGQNELKGKSESGAVVRSRTFKAKMEGLCLYTLLLTPTPESDLQHTFVTFVIFLFISVANLMQNACIVHGKMG